MADNTAASGSRLSTKLRDILMSDKHSLSYADFHHQITRNANSYLPKSSGSQQSHGIEGKTEEDELAKYMSNKPSYFEKGKLFQEKPLNVGVLDWRHLEKWKYNNNPMAQKNRGFSSCTSSTSYFSTERSSSRSSRGHSSSPSRQRMHHSSLQSHLEASPMQTFPQYKCSSGRGHSCSPSRQRTSHLVPHSYHQKVYPWEGHSHNLDLITGNIDPFKEIPESIPNHRIRQQKHYGMDQSCGKNQSEVRTEMSEKKESNSNTNSEIGKRQTWGNPDAVTLENGKLKIRESELKEAMRTRLRNPSDHLPDRSKERNTVVLLVPRDTPINRGLPNLSDSAVPDNQIPRECGAKSSLEKENFKKVPGLNLSSNIPYSCSLPSQDETRRMSEMKGSCATSLSGIKVSSEQLKSPSRSTDAEEKKPIVVLRSSSKIHLSGEFDKRTASEPTHLSDSAFPVNRMPKACGGKSSSEKNHFKDVHGSDLSPNVPCSCSLPSEDDTKRKSDMARSCSTGLSGVKISSQQLKSPSRSRNTEEKKPIVVLRSSSKIHLSGELDRRAGSGPTHLSDSAVPANQMPRVRGGKSFSEKDNSKEARGADLSSNVPYPHPLLSQDDSKNKSEMKESCSTNPSGVKIPSQQLKSPSRSRNTEEKRSRAVLRSSSSPPLSGELDKRTGSESTTKVRHTSPIRRLGSAVGSIIRSAGSRDNSPVGRSSSKGLGLDRAASSASLDTDKSQPNNRARSSPLRRLLDPLIKPKAPNVRELAEPVRDGSASTAGPWKSSDEQLDLLKTESMKVKSTPSGKTKGAKGSHQDVKNGTSLQALLQVAVKNGLPLFTFAVDNDSDILVATLTKSSAAEKERSGFIYTFFSVHEMKKKNAMWLSQGRKANGHYLPSAVAQMVSGLQVPVVTMGKDTADDRIREFTLFSVGVDQHSTGFQPVDELAAIVVELLKETAGSPNSTPIDPSETCFQGCSVETRDPDSSDTSQEMRSIRNQIPVSTTVILPGGVHTIPNKGSISTLAQRWRSGGSCDCGGWDLGCQLRILTNQGESQKLLTSSKTTNTSDQFNLFCHVGKESQLVLSLKPFKDMIYSVEFDSSISLVQAFATCVAVLECTRLSGFFTNSNVVDQRSSTASILDDPGQIKAPNQSYGEPPASYIPCPPYSPVGRV